MIIPQAVAVMAAAALVTGCAAGGGSASSNISTATVQSPDASVSSPPVTVIATRTATGGLCVSGSVCETVFTVSSDGTWTSASGDQAQSGVLDEVMLAAILDATTTTTLPDAPAFTGTCPVAYDGQEVVYSWVDESNTTITVSACDKEVPPNDPLALALDTAANLAAQAPGDGMDAQAARTQAVANTVLGMPEDEAIATIEGVSSMKLTTRVVRRDAQTYPVTEDYWPTRVNLSIHAGIVTDATVG